MKISKSNHTLIEIINSSLILIWLKFNLWCLLKDLTKSKYFIVRY